MDNGLTLVMDKRLNGEQANNKKITDIRNSRTVVTNIITSGAVLFTSFLSFVREEAQCLIGLYGNQDRPLTRQIFKFFKYLTKIINKIMCSLSVLLSSWRLLTTLGQTTELLVN